MGIPQIIMILLYRFNLGAAIRNHGKPKEGYDNFWISLIGTIVNVSILYWGGFWE